MAVRTTSPSVQAVLVGHYDSANAVNLTPFIDVASNLVDWIASEDSSNLMDSASLELVERWLTAHFYAHADQLLQSKTTQKASAVFQGQTGMILKSTQYGQTAMLLDKTGLLAKKSADAESGIKRSVTVTWAGTEYT